MLLPTGTLICIELYDIQELDDEIYVRESNPFKDLQVEIMVNIFFLYLLEAKTTNMFLKMEDHYRNFMAERCYIVYLYSFAVQEETDDRIYSIISRMCALESENYMESEIHTEILQSIARRYTSSRKRKYSEIDTTINFFLF
ncbi:hypothetical protein RF11_01225 [Thelohanellus kitauei]|uniref:Uncharacterized protein n=1 Tax=Thelohanellus kitauei TaxID=669202 RepID=A0A0C2NF33_THEKT|nr:hypothetical protein RF11_01225 [Thelohanellus kitauei]